MSALSMPTDSCLGAGPACRPWECGSEDGNASTVASSEVSRRRCASRRRFDSNNSDSSFASSNDCSDAGWRTRTPSPELSYYAMTGRAERHTLPTCLLVLPVPMTVVVPVAITAAQAPAGMTATAVAAVAAATEATQPTSAASGASDDDKEDGARMPPIVERPSNLVVRRASKVMRIRSWADASDDDDKELRSDSWSAPVEAASAVSCEECLPSIGSDGHSCGTCRPCAHAWRPEGCSKGRDCTYCHLCGYDEFLTYKHEYKVSRAVARRAKARAAAEAKGRPTH